MSDENIIKKTCKELGLTYKQLGELIGYSEGAIKSAINSGNISEPMKRAIELYQETLNLKAELEKSEAFKSNLKDFLKG
ncbi:transcriptional regulator [Campylobacter sp. faydin G-24]|uniref:Transcriptional regulator n=1 Tax=Campylobacter anatolicus TaxID=2829105 RepID=A0ABS5HJJ0_9BACT|nr:transcriptional regulator [Campylobacter anatolicus]MBR8464434.1 transcriptional regulator [Campylobacter anatolicus]